MRVLNTCARAQKARFLIAAGGEAGTAYASAADARDSTVPLAFPYGDHAAEHAALCEHAHPEATMSRSAWSLSALAATASN
jgi:hypothetical protein